MESDPRLVGGLVVVLGTGGTIAGVTAAPEQHVGYTAAALGVDALIAAVPALRGVALEADDVARLDSSNMDHATWALLAARAAWHLARPEVAGIVITHGTDTLEETAYLLHRTVQADKPIALTAAMRPATALSADGPQNLLDAVTVARSANQHGLRGVLAVLAGRVHAGVDLRKLHGLRVDAFSSGDAGVLALLEDNAVRVLRTPPQQRCHGADLQRGAAAGWPVVDIVTSHAGARGAVIDALVAAGAQGIVIAGTGNGSVHASLQAAAERALAAGVRVLRASRCVLGGVVGSTPGGVVGGTPSGWAGSTPDGVAGSTPGGVVGNPPGALPSAGPLTPVQARIELLLDLLAEHQG